MLGADYGDDDISETGIYDGGYWEWCEIENRLKFTKSGNAESLDYLTIITLGGVVEFKDDMDPLEEQRFKKRYQRQYFLGDDDCVTLQDVKDVVLYSTPSFMLSKNIVKILHVPATERYIRTLVLYCQYFLQINEEMAKRVMQLETRLPTENGNAIEKEYMENLEELRLLVASEYAITLLGGAGLDKYHHMGADKKIGSLSKRDAHFCESLLRIMIQIVWVALGRRAYNQLDLEVNRLFKSKIFNIVEHRAANTNVLTPKERNVLLGKCLRRDKKLCTRSPLMNELKCHKHVDFRTFGLGFVRYHNLTHRQRFLEFLLSQPEQDFQKYNVTLGIIGMPRSNFDIMLREIPTGPGSSSVSSRTSSMHRKSSRIMKLKSKMETMKLYPDMVLPEKTTTTISHLASFPTKMLPEFKCNYIQRQKWLDRVVRLANKKSTRYSSCSKHKTRIPV